MTERSQQAAIRTLKDYRPQHMDDCLKMLKCRWCEQPKTQHSGHAFEPARDYQRTPLPDSVVACSCGLDALLAGAVALEEE